MKKIGFVGLGLMGSRMAANLVRRGFSVSVWNRSREKCTPLVEMGAKLAESLEDLSRSSDAIVSMLRDDTVVKDVIINSALPAAKAGSAFIDLSTVTPSLCREFAARATERGCEYLDAPVLGSRDAAAAGQLSIIVGGPTEVLEKHRDILEAMGQRITHLGPNGSSAYLKLANNQMVAVFLASIGESLALIERAGLDRKLAFGILAEAASRVVGMKQQKIAEQEWSTHFALELMLKDINLTLNAAEEIGAQLPILAATRERYELALKQGMDDLDFSAITAVHER